jgi:hypothetical protein
MWLQGNPEGFRSWQNGQNRCLLQNSNTVRISQRDLLSKKSRRVHEILRLLLAGIPGAGSIDNDVINHA